MSAVPEGTSYRLFPPVASFCLTRPLYHFFFPPPARWNLCRRTPARVFRSTSAVSRGSFFPPPPSPSPIARGGGGDGDGNELVRSSINLSSGVRAARPLALPRCTQSMTTTGARGRERNTEEADLIGGARTHIHTHTHAGASTDAKTTPSASPNPHVLKPSQEQQQRGCCQGSHGTSQLIGRPRSSR